MKKDDDVYVPKNVKKKLEFFNGFGVKELIITIITTIILIVPCLIIYKYNQVLAMSLFLTLVATTVMLVTKDNNDVSFFYKIKLVMKNIFMQKEYKNRKEKKI